MAQAQGWFRYKLARELEEEEIDALKALAGPIYLSRSREVVVHTNAAWMAERHLRANGFTFTVREAPLLPAPFAALPPLPELREWVPDFLTHYQRDFILWASTKDGVLGVLPTGAGKTLSGICYGLLRPGTVVFITRAAARMTIAEDVVRYTTCRPLVLAESPPKKKRHPDVDYATGGIDPGRRFVIVGWESLKHHVKAILAADPTTVIFDESHLASNHKRREAIVQRSEDGETIRREDGREAIVFKKLDNRFAAAEDIARHASVKYRMALTATPIRDRLRNLWAQLDLLLPRTFGPFRAWAMRYCDGHQNQWGGTDYDGRSNVEELLNRIGFLTYYVPHSVTHRDLPAKRRQVTYLKPEDLASGKDVLKELREHRGDAAWAKLAHAAAMKRPLVVQAALDGAAPSADGKGGGKVVVLTGLRADAEKIAAAAVKESERLVKKGGQPLTIFMGHGGHAPAERDEMRRAYMAHPGPCALVGTSDSWGESLNLHDTDLALVAMLPYTPGQVRQLEGRFSRRGQKRPVLVRYFIAEGTADEHVAHLLLDKLPAVEAVARDEVLTEFANDLRGDENEVVDGLLAKLLADDDEEEDAAATGTEE